MLTNFKIELLIEINLVKKLSKYYTHSIFYKLGNFKKVFF